MSDNDSGGRRIIGGMAHALWVAPLLVLLGYLIWGDTSTSENVSLLLNRDRTEDIEKMREMGDEAFAGYPGWFGMARVDAAVLSVVSADDDSEFAQFANELFKSDVSIAIVMVNNSKGDKALVFEPSTVDFRQPGGGGVRALRSGRVVATAKKNRKKAMEYLTGEIEIPAGETDLGRMVFLPRGADLSGSRSVVLRINGELREIKGEFLTARQKRALLNDRSKGF